MTEILFLSQEVEYFNLLTTGGSWSPTTFKLKKSFYILIPKLGLSHIHEQIKT